MKTNYRLFILLGLFKSLVVFSQQVSVSSNDYSIAFQKNEQLFLIRAQKHKEIKEITNTASIENKIWNGDLMVRFPSAISQNFAINKGWVFYTGIQSPYDQNTWLCLERTIIGNEFNLFLFDTKKGSKRILINNNNSFKNAAFRPVCWSKDKNVVYFERIVFDNAFEHEGVFSYTINTAELKQLSISKKYMTTPLISIDRKYFTYSATSNEERDLVHGFGDQLIVFDLENNEETVLSEEAGAFHQILGWYLNKPFKKKQIKRSAKGNYQNNTTQLSFKLPWEGGVTYCVTRDGSFAPTGAVGSSITCSDLGQHSYPAATDYDTPNNSDEKILAVAAGTVTTVIYGNTGYGNHVIITHPDNFRTLYGHFFSIAVTQGQEVQQGCYIGMEGTTGGSSGDHLHLEYEYPGGSGNLYATFDDCGGCIPHRGYSYTSGNSIQSCTAPVAPPFNDSCSAAQILIPNSSCVSVAGDVTGAIASGLSAPSCDDFATPALKDIWYQFVATSPTHKIIVNPSGSFDEVIAVYTSCSAGELFCKDDGGLGVADSINATGLTIGATYYVRVYDYGSIGPTTPTFNICVTTPNFTTGVNQTDGNNESEIDIFPNPSDGTVLNGILLDEKAIKINVKLHDVIGREVFTKDTPVIDGKFSLSFVNGLNPGMYMLTGIANGKRYTKRVVIK